MDRKKIEFLIVTTFYLLLTGEMQAQEAQLIFPSDHGGFVTDAVFSPSGRRVLSTGGNTMKLKDVSTGRELKSFALEERYNVTSVCFGNNEDFFLCGDHTGNIYGWSIKQERPLWKVRGHEGKIYSLDINTNESHFVSTGGDGNAILWDLASHNQVRSMPIGPVLDRGTDIRSLKVGGAGAYFHSNDSILIMHGSERAFFFNIYTNEIKFFGSKEFTISLVPDSVKDYLSTSLKQFVDIGGGISCAKFRPGTSQIAIGGAKGVALYEVPTKDKKNFQGTKIRFWSIQKVVSMAFSPDGQTLIVGDGISRINVINPDSSGIKKTFQAHFLKNQGFSAKSGFSLNWQMPAATSIDFASNGKFFATAGTEKRVAIWALPDFKKFQSLENLRPSTTSLLFSNDSRSLRVGRSDGTTRMWDLNTMREKQHQIAHRDSTYYWSGYLYYRKKEGETEQEAEEKRLKAILPTSVNDLCLSSDNLHFWTTGGDCFIRKWDAQSGKLVETIKASKEIFSLGQLDQNRMISSDNDGQIKVWRSQHELPITLILDKNETIRQFFAKNLSSRKRVLNVATSSGVLSIFDLSKLKIPSFTKDDMIEIPQILFEDRKKNEARGFEVLNHVLYVLTSEGMVKAIDISDTEYPNILNEQLNDNPGKSIYVSPKNNHLLLLEEGGKLRRLDTAKKLDFQEFYRLDPETQQIMLNHQGDILLGISKSTIAGYSYPDMTNLYNIDIHDRPTSYEFSPDNKFLALAFDDGEIQLIAARTGIPQLRLISFEEMGESVVLSSENFYFGPKESMRNIHFVRDGDMYSFEQFDLQFNRPHKVLEKTGYTPNAEIERHKRAFEKRVQRSGISKDQLILPSQPPTCEIMNWDSIPVWTNSPKMPIRIKAADNATSIHAIKVWVNNVPLWGINGLPIIGGGKTVERIFNIELSTGENKIEVAAVNANGAESLKAITFVAYENPDNIPNLYILTIGVSEYKDSNWQDLEFAHKDAQDIAAAYQQKKLFPNTIIRTLTNEDAVKENILAFKQVLLKSNVDDHVILFFSGHGMLDQNKNFVFATHDTPVQNPLSRGFSYDEIEWLLDSIPARHKLLMIDACQAGTYDKELPFSPEGLELLRQKGIIFQKIEKTKGDVPITLNFQTDLELMEQLFYDLGRGSGATVITSSSGVQVSIELNDKKNGALTFAFLNGMKERTGDTNQDGKIYVSEIVPFLSQQVFEITDGVQTPMFRQQNLEYDFRVW